MNHGLIGLEKFLGKGGEVSAATGSSKSHPCHEIGAGSSSEGPCEPVFRTSARRGAGYQLRAPRGFVWCHGEPYALGFPQKHSPPVLVLWSLRPDRANS